MAEKNDDVYDLADDDDDDAAATQAAAAAARHAQQSAPRAPADARAPSMYHRPKPVQVQQPDKKGEYTKIGIVVGVVLLAAVAIWGVGMLGGDQAAAEANLKGDDAEVLRKIDQESGTEVRQWLSNKHNMGIGNGNFNERQTEATVDKWYEMGAKTVYAFGSRLSLSVAIELPDEPDQRKALFDWCNERLPLGEPLKVDEGQRYILMPLTGITR